MTLADFRSYAALDLSLSAPLVALAGENGAGKTNILEALSLFTPGRGLRRAELAEMARIGGEGGFAVAIALSEEGAPLRLGTGLEPRPGEPAVRRSRIDGVPVGSPAAFAEHVRLVWLTPAMDGLFAGSAGERRRFLDRMVLGIDARHGARVNAFERALRGRNRLLAEPAPDRAWLDGIEAEIAPLAVAVAAARRATVDRLARVIAAHRDDASAFPWAGVVLEGTIEEMLTTLPEVEAETRYRALLREGRGRDAAAGRALAGPQASDLLVWHGPKDVPAERASTGEQKALLIGLVLAHARLVAEASGIAPFVLLDEIAAHLDPRRRAALYTALSGLGSQVFMTGADPALFADLPAGSETFLVAPGAVRPL
nr:DNA replication/repair protein RecF [Prosthecomicrobium pneumaticum]